MKSTDKPPENRLRVVLDTNILVSATLSRGSMKALALDLAVSKRIQLYVSDAVLCEYEDVLHRDKFLKVPRTVIHDTLALVKRIALYVTPHHTVSASRDDDDNRFLECAEAAEADYLVTGNTKHFPDYWKKTRIVRAPELLQAISKELDES